MLGFFDLLGTKVPPELRKKTSDRWIPFMSDIRTVGAAVRVLRERLEFYLQSPTGIRTQIYASIVEAMKNTHQHAYPSDLNGFPEEDRRSEPAINKRWWMTARVEPHAREIQLAFLDQGVTIPMSLQTSWMWPELQAVLPTGSIGGAEYDALLLVEAMRYGNSRLQGETHRGKGFLDIKYPATLNEKNRLRIYSRHAHYTNLGGRGIAAGSGVPFPGTLIEWHLHVPGAPSEGGHTV